MSVMQSKSELVDFNGLSLTGPGKMHYDEFMQIGAGPHSKRTFLMKAKNVFSYARELGLGNAVRIAWQKLSGHNLMKLRMRGIKNSLYCRTNDLYVMLEVFGGRCGRVYDPALRGKPQLIIDAGANVGFVSALLANLFPEARVISIEPDVANSEIFRRNCGGYSNVRLIEAALWYRPGHLKIENPSDAGFLLRVTEDDAPGIPAVTIPEILQAEGADRIDILKLDVEGAEKVLFSKNNEWLRKVKLMVVELHDRYESGCREAMLAAIAGRKFQHTQRNGVDLVEFFDV